MTLQEYGEIISNSKKEDWNIITCWGAGAGPSYQNSFSVWTQGGEFSNIDIDSHSMIGVYKPNIDITIAWGLESNSEFISEWANKFDDSHATSSFIDFFLRGHMIFRDILVTVDGGRVHIPIPLLRRIEDTESKEKFRRIVPGNKYEFFKILNSLESSFDYEETFRRTGLEIVDEPWIQ